VVNKAVDDYQPHIKWNFRHIYVQMMVIESKKNSSKFGTNDIQPTNTKGQRIERFNNKKWLNSRFACP